MSDSKRWPHAEPRRNAFREMLARRVCASSAINCHRTDCPQVGRCMSGLFDAAHYFRAVDAILDALKEECGFDPGSHDR